MEEPQGGQLEQQSRKRRSNSPGEEQPPGGFSSCFKKRAMAPHPRRRQYFLDLGQSDFSYTTCTVCGLLYARGQEDDEKVHEGFHRSFLRGVPFNGWRNERVVARLDDGSRIILVLPDDPRQHHNKVKEVAAVMENEMGLAPDWLLRPGCKVYLYVASKRVQGCAVVESIKTAYPVIPQVPSTCTEQKQKDVNTKKELLFGNIKFTREVSRKTKPSASGLPDFGKPVTCSTEAVPAVCGFRAVWVMHCARRKGVGSRILDAARKTFHNDSEVPISKCAFSQPTADGVAFASKYCETDKFLVYH